MRGEHDNIIFSYIKGNNKPSYVVKYAYEEVKQLGLQFEIQLYHEVLKPLKLPHILRILPFCKNELKLTYTDGMSLYDNMKRTNGYYMLTYPDVFFQIIWTLNTFQQLGIIHHDLHFRNIIIEERPYYSYYEYTLDDNYIFRGWSKTHVYIIDFDHGTKTQTRRNATTIYNKALDHWVDTGAYNKNPIVNYDWFTFIFYLHSYNSVYNIYVETYKLKHIPAFPPLLFPGRPISKDGTVLYNILCSLELPLIVLRKWSNITDNTYNISIRTALPLPPFPIFIYNQHIPTWCTTETRTHSQKHHPQVVNCADTTSELFSVFFRWCGVFLHYPYYIKQNTGLAYNKHAWLLYLTHGEICPNEHIIYICQPYKRICIEITKHKTINNIDSYRHVPCLFDCCGVYKKKTTTIWHTWYPCLLYHIMCTMNLKWEHLYMTPYLVSMANHDF